MDDVKISRLNKNNLEILKNVAICDSTSIFLG
jgi:hypothetical protein